MKMNQKREGMDEIIHSTQICDVSVQVSVSTLFLFPTDLCLYITYQFPELVTVPPLPSQRIVNDSTALKTISTRESAIPSSISEIPPICRA